MAIITGCVPTIRKKKDRKSIKSPTTMKARAIGELMKKRRLMRMALKN